MSPLQSTLALTALFLSFGIHANTYPERPITLMVPWPAGGIVDAVARDLAQGMSLKLGQRIVVENRPGAGGTIGTEIVARAQPDGYTIVMGTVTTHAINQTLYRNIRYHALNDFEPIVMATLTPLVLIASKPVTARDISGLIAHAKANPGKLTYASAGAGSTTHLAGEQFKTMTGTDIVHVPYKGQPAAILDLLAGRVDLMFASQSLVEGHLQAGDLRALAVTSRDRVPSAPNVPSLNEAGVKDFNNIAWFGLLAPKRTPEPIVQRLNVVANEVLRDPAFAARHIKTGSAIVGGTPEAFRQVINDELKQWAIIIKATGATAD